MIDIAEALRLLNAHLGNKKIERRELSECLFRVLAQDITAKRDGPPYPRVTMDGVAIAWSDYMQGQRKFPIIGIQKAGGKKLSLRKPYASHTCMEVMTGAILPEGHDTVIPFEKIDLRDGIVYLDSVEIQQGQNVHPQGFDYVKGECLLHRGTFLRSPEIAVLSSNGEWKVEVYRQPQISIAVTGDELVDIREEPEEHQIWISNLYALQSELQAFGLRGIIAQNFPDDVDILKVELEKILLKNEILIISGGVSKGRFDYVPQVLQSLRVEKIFHQVSQRPGRPLYFGKRGDTLIFGLPGNPISSVINLRRYVLPTIWNLMGWDREFHDRIVRLSQDFEFVKPLTYFLPVKMESDKATPVTVKGSGDFKSLTESDGFVELDKEQNCFKQDDRLKFFQWGSL